jgi:hypothetical protein
LEPFGITASLFSSGVPIEKMGAKIGKEVLFDQETQSLTIDFFALQDAQV